MTGTIIYWIAFAIIAVLSILCKRNIYSDYDDKPIFSTGITIVVILAGLIPYFNCVAAFVFILIICTVAIEGDITFEFKNEFIKDLFTR